MTDSSVYLVGHRAFHHARVSGYEGFRRYVGSTLPPPVRFHWLTSSWGWRLDSAVARLLGRRHYSLAMLLTEGAAAFHMLRHRKALYHSIYGDMDLWLLPRVGRPLGNRTVATFHEPPATLRWLEIDGTIRKLDAAILVSAYQRPYFEGLLAADRVFVVPHGIDTDFFRPAAEPPQTRLCITVGSHLRDYPCLREAMDRVWSVLPEVRVVAVGARAKGAAAAPFGGDSRIRLLDGVSDEELRSAYQSAGIAVFPFKDATANNALLEAMACGLPLVSTDVGGVCEYVGDAAGILCRPQDPEDLAAAMLKILGDPQLARGMSRASRRRAEAYDYRRVADRMRETYTAILSLDVAAARHRALGAE